MCVRPYRKTDYNSTSSDGNNSGNHDKQTKRNESIDR